MLTRRRFAIGSFAALLPAKALAGTRCVPDPKRGGELCKVYVDVTDAYQETYHAKREPAAIWVACVAVVFARYGHVVQQQRLAEEAYGGVEGVALDKGVIVAEPLMRRWTDDDGAAFRVAAEPVFDADAKGAAFDQTALIGAVSHGDPVILMAARPVVLTALAYAPDRTAQRLVAGFVFDPLPMVGSRALNIAEVVPKGAGGELRFAVRLRLEAG